MKSWRYFWSDHECSAPGRSGSDQNCRLALFYCPGFCRQFCSEPLTSTKRQKIEAPNASPPLRACRTLSLSRTANSRKTARASRTSLRGISPESWNRFVVLEWLQWISGSWWSKRGTASKSPQGRAFIGRVVSIGVSRWEVIRAKISMLSGR